jgi:hypothetical protein
MTETNDVMAVAKAQGVVRRILDLCKDWEIPNGHNTQFLHLTKDDETSFAIAVDIWKEDMGTDMPKRPKHIMGFEVVYDAPETKVSDRKDTP